MLHSDDEVLDLYKVSNQNTVLTLVHSERPNSHTILAFKGAIGLRQTRTHYKKCANSAEFYQNLIVPQSTDTQSLARDTP